MTSPDPANGTSSIPSRDTEDIFARESAYLKRPNSITRSIPKLLGQYKIISQLGKGGMARVYLAEHVNMQRRVALKVLPDDLARNRAAQERFYREARTAAALDHPNIVRAYDVRDADGIHFLVMEYVEGQDLEAIMNARGTIAVIDAVEWVVAAARGLEHAHSKKIVHRDIKPSNLLLDKHGTIKILDMGLARFHDQQEDRVTDQFDSGVVMCTPDYAAPEQIVQAEHADHRLDIYSLGATLYALLAGRPPYEGSVTQKLIAHQSRTAIPLHRLRTDIPRDLSDVVAKMMAKNPQARYQTAAETIRALSPWRRHSPEPISRLVPETQTFISTNTPTDDEWSEFMHAVEAEPIHTEPMPDNRRAFVMGLVALLPVVLVVFLMIRQVIAVVKG